jgi:hypothetical protein
MPMQELPNTYGKTNFPIGIFLLKGRDQLNVSNHLLAVFPLCVLSHLVSSTVTLMVILTIIFLPIGLCLLIYLS